jgi:uncharacterized membrane protein
MALTPLRIAAFGVAAAALAVATLVYGNLLLGVVVAISVVVVAEEYRVVGLERAAVVAVAGWTVSAAAWRSSLLVFVLACCFAYLLLQLHSRFGLPGAGRAD